MGNDLRITTSERMREADGTEKINCCDMATEALANPKGALNLG